MQPSTISLSLIAPRASAGGAPAPVDPTPLYAFDVVTAGHYTDTAGKISALINQGSWPGSLTTAAAGNQPTHTGNYAVFDAAASPNHDYLAMPLIDATPLIARHVLPDGRGGGNDTALAAYPSWSAATTYTAGASASWVLNTFDSKNYYLGAGAGTSLNERPDLTPAKWILLDDRAFSATGACRNRKKGSGYCVANDGRRHQGDAFTVNKPSVVFLNEDFSKDTAYGNGTGDRTGELILSDFDGSSVQSLDFDPDDTNYIWIVVVGTGLVRIHITTAVVTHTLTGGTLGSVNGMAVLGDADPLTDGTYFVTMGASDQVLTRRSKTGAVLGTRNIGATGDNMWWWPEKNVLTCYVNGKALVYSAYGVKCGVFPNNQSLATFTTYADTGYSTDAINRGECAVVAWDGVRLLITHNGSFHQSGSPVASPIVSSISEYTLVGGGVMSDSPCLDLLQRCFVTTWASSKTIGQLGDPAGQMGGCGMWSDSSATTNLRVYASVAGTAQSALFDLGSKIPTDHILHVAFDGPNASVSVYLDNVLIRTDTTAFTDFFAIKRIGVGMFALGDNPLSATRRSSSLNFKAASVYATATGLTAAQRTAAYTAMAALA